MKGVLLMIAVLLAFLSCGRGGEHEYITNERFNVEYHGTKVDIIEDTETGVKYMFYGDGNRGGLTKLEEMDKNMNGGKDNE